jgi:hypothetical protein
MGAGSEGVGAPVPLRALVGDERRLVCLGAQPQLHPGLAALDAETGSPLAFYPYPNMGVYALAHSDDTLYVAGVFTTIGGKARDGLAAIDLASAATSVLTSYVAELDEGIPAGRQITVSPLGAPEGGTVNDGANPVLAILAFLGIFGVLCTVIVLGSGLVRQWRAQRELEDREKARPDRPGPMPQIPDDELLRPPPVDHQGAPFRAPAPYR